MANCGLFGVDKSFKMLANAFLIFWLRFACWPLSKAALAVWVAALAKCFDRLTAHEHCKSNDFRASRHQPQQQQQHCRKQSNEHRAASNDIAAEVLPLSL